MTLHWWMHWFWITITTLPALVLLVLFSSLTASPQVPFQHGSDAALLAGSGRGTRHVEQITGLSGRTKPTLPFPVAQLTSFSHQDAYFGLYRMKNTTSKQEMYKQNHKHSRKHPPFLHFVLLHSKKFSLLYQMCVNNFMKTVGHSGIKRKNTMVTNVKAKLKEDFAQSVFSPRVWQSVVSEESSVQNWTSAPLQTKDKISKQNLANRRYRKAHPSPQTPPVNGTNFDNRSSKHLPAFDSKNTYSGIIFPYCASVFKKIFTPLATNGETMQNKLLVSNPLIAYLKKMENIEDNSESQNQIFSSKFGQLVRRKKSVNLQTPQLKHKSDIEFPLKHSAVYSKMVTEISTESVSSLYPANVQKNAGSKRDILHHNSMLGKWLNALVKQFNNSYYNISKIQAGYLENASITGELKHVPSLMGSLSLVLDITGHEGSENSSSDTSSQTKSIENVSEYPSLSTSHTVSSENVSPSFAIIYDNVPVKNEKFVPTDIPNVFVPITDYSVVISSPSKETILSSKTMQDSGGSSNDSSLAGSVSVGSSVNIDFLNIISTLSTVQQGTNRTEISQFTNGVVEISETVTPVIQTTKEEMEGTGTVVGSEKSSKAALITGVVLAVVILTGLFGTVLFVLFRQHFLNKPQTFNDKCSNPDSSGYIDDSTLRENSEEMYSLDNDSFLNSLEAMTIQNYWTDNVKHTKL